jgi:hypothetical protein
MTLLDTLEPVGDPASSRGDHTRCLSPCMKSMKVDGIQGRCCLDGINSGARPSSWATSGAVLYAQCSCAHALTWGCFSAELEMVMSLARGTIRSGLILLNALRLPGDAGLCLCTVFAQQEEAQLRSLQKQLVNVSTTLQFTTRISYFSSLFYSAVRRPILYHKAPKMNFSFAKIKTMGRTCSVTSTSH